MSSSFGILKVFKWCWAYGRGFSLLLMKHSASAWQGWSVKYLYGLGWDQSDRPPAGAWPCRNFLPTVLGLHSDCQIPEWPGWVRVEYGEAHAWGCLLKAQKCPKLFWSFNSNYVLLGPCSPGRESLEFMKSSSSQNNLKLDLRRLGLWSGLGSHIWRNYSSGKGLTCSGCWARASWAEKTLPTASPPLKARQVT